MAEGRILEVTTVKIEMCDDDDTNESHTSLTDNGLETATVNQDETTTKKEFDQNEKLSHSDLFETTVVKIEYDPNDSKREANEIPTSESSKSQQVIRKKFQCNQCPYATIYKSDLVNHTYTHFPMKAFKCDICGKSFKTRGYLGRHKFIHKGLHCSICKKKFPDEKLLNQHKAEPGAHKIFQCDQCQYTTLRQSSFIKHAHAHSTIRAFKCETCEKSFKTQAHLNEHKVLHEGFRSCGICHKKFPNEGLLNEHKATPGIHKMLQCELCSYSTAYKSSLVRHSHTHSSVKSLNGDDCENSGENE